MYTNKKNVLELVSLLHAHHIEHIVLCPGSRNVPIVKSIAKSKLFKCYSITDERSAAFFAMGLILETKKPCALCITSGSALLNTAPAISEAFYQKLPLLVISADRQKSFIGQMDGQTINQERIFPDITKKQVSLPEIHDNDSHWLCNRLINEALLALSLDDTGPVHINVPISDPFFKEDVPNLPCVRTIRYTDFEHLHKLMHEHKKIMVIAGQNQHVLKLNGNTDNFVFIKEHLSNIHNVRGIDNIELLLASLSDEQKESIKPTLVISIGGHILSKKLKIFLRSCSFLHVNIMPGDEIADVFCSLAYHINATVDKALSFVLGQNATLKANKDYVDNFYALSEKITPPALPFCHIQAIGSVIASLSDGSSLHLSNSSSVRYAQLFGIDRDVSIQGNRGVNGIEGSLSTAIGASCATSSLSYIIIGDLSFFYDMNALFNMHVPRNVRIVLINNAGGEIFAALPGLSLNDESSRYIVAPHQFSAKGWAQSAGLVYLEAHNTEDLTASVAALKEGSERAMLLEVFTDNGQDIELLKQYYTDVKHKFEE
ncbi:2-succinyl-5-enolpyruvyl-6-hydroxy-3-cyclohexene-1-carboxylate synthase [Anaerobiospirillum thomasii]|uniref:2-succinyl-5-enolpyruvyl-6-hydroxy-3- cyclohexene-1-carboxylic-acid synthase n=1 Tax=Anaerobiospirillum thomasii TaxID=179995 RepID=UPI000D993E34|nr:2-succinyl-5-enolpyruvyl-6-hydroxy-3-cyclohexene-1-carboxylic-acid synthase [Anaerobiospirillum thomasii]SPT67684.1 2-succinyl-5-enolpyruvyl-6-hydroxy-3-cyclohexene-1-carboxylate synthase [Anaerobiospirillum thomasii]